MKLFDDIEEALDYITETNIPITCGVFNENNKTMGMIYKIFPSRNYERIGQFVGLHSKQEVWNHKSKKWEPAA